MSAEKDSLVLDRHPTTIYTGPMSRAFYKNVSQIGNFIYHRWVNDLGQVREEYTDKVGIDLYIPTKDESEYQSFYEGAPLKEMHYDSIRDAKKFVDEMRDISNLPIHGQRTWWGQFIANEYPQPIKWDMDKLIVANIDIETSMTWDDGSTGFPDPELAPAPITAITVEVNNHYYTFGSKEFTGEFEEGIECTYKWCKTEQDLLLDFLLWWEELKPDLITGWNIVGFDIPFLINRITNLLGHDNACRLSPAHKFLKRKAVNRWEKNRHGKTYVEYTIYGLAVNDMLALYKNYTFKLQERYSLDYIAYVELGEKKLDYSEYGNLDGLYANDYNKFINYNIRDVKLVRRLDDKKRFISLALSICFLAKIRHDDHFFQTRVWDAMIYNRLKRENVVMPPMRNMDKDDQYTGAIVFDPQIGMHNWVVSADLNSLYPSLIRQYNISPEMLISRAELEAGSSDPEKDEACKVLLQFWHPSRDQTTIRINDLVEGKEHPVHAAARTLDLSLAANGSLYSKRRLGVLPQLMEEIYGQRVEMKNKMLDAEQKFEDTADKKYSQKKSMYGTMQLAYKIMLNSCYGALGTEHFRLYNVDMAESITISGQLSIQWVQKRVNAYLQKLLKSETDFIIAGDTDSFYMSLDEFVQKVTNGKEYVVTDIVDMVDLFFKKKIQPIIDKGYADLKEFMNAYDQQMFMSREVIADRGVWRAKKNYALNVWDSEGVRYHKPKLKIMGMEAIKSSTPEMCRAALKESIRIILQEHESDLQRYAAEFKKEFYNAPADAVAFPTGISDIDKWNNHSDMGFTKGTPLHVRSAIVYNRLLSAKKLEKVYRVVGNGDKIKYVYLTEPNPTHTKVCGWPDILPPEFDLDKYIDYQLQYTKTYIAPLESITDKIGWSVAKKARLF